VTVIKINAITVPEDSGDELARRFASSACGYATARYNAKSGPGRFEDSAPYVRYDGWRNLFVKSAIGGAYRTSRLRGDTAVFTSPKATSVSWLTHLGPNQGRARVSVDGQFKGVFDLYSASSQARTYAFAGLAWKAHTVKVTVLGTKNTSSRGAWVALDGFEVR